MRIAVIGAGAMGSLVSYLLDAGGMEVVLYERREERIADIRENGVRLQGRMEGSREIEIKAVGEPDAPFDLMVVTTPAGDAADVIRPVSPFVHRDTRYLSLQEGSAVEELAQVVGAERTGGIIAWVSAVLTPSGTVEVEDFRSMVLGASIGGDDNKLSLLVEALNHETQGKAAFTSDLKKEMWHRLESAAAVSALCGVTGAPPEAMRDRKEVDAICREAAQECLQVAASQGLRAPPQSPIWEEAVWSKLKPPMLLALEAGRGTEVEFLSGYIVGHSRSSGKPSSVHSAMYSLIKEMESGERRPGENSLKELQRRIEEERGMSLL
jgi:2-dehydropantoate 2-reductase